MALEQSLPEAFSSLSSSGLYEIVLPFLIVFGIVYALLDTAELFGEKNDQLSAIIAIAFAFFTVEYFDFGLFLEDFAGPFGLLILLFVVIGATAALGGFKVSDWTYGGVGIFGILAVLGVLLLIWQQDALGQVYGTVDLPGVGSVNLWTIGFLALIAGAVYWLTQ